MDIKKLKNYLKEKKIPDYRLKQILKAIYQEGVDSFLKISTLPKNLRDDLSQQIDILPFEIKKVFASSYKDSFKALLKLRDDYLVETVLMKQNSGWTVCVSSQVGCAVGCVFCATGKIGFKRNLDWDEIVSQVLFWKQYILKNALDNEVRNVVFMGMGEPFLNFDEVRKSIFKLTDESLFNLGIRHISISSSGIIPQIKKLLIDFPQINLAISIISANDKIREKLMPINKKYNLEDIKEFLNYYFENFNRKIFLEYVLFGDVNDKYEDAQELIQFVKFCKRPDLLHVNLISYNKTTNDFKKIDKKTIQNFEKFLKDNGLQATIRKSLGSDIDAACGQLGLS